MLKDLDFDESQSRAIERCIDTSHLNRVVPITGVAGTGKTSILQEVHETLVEQGHVVALCAPTGKAAKRIKELTGIDAMTIHRLLEYPHPGEMDTKTGKPLRSTDPKKDRDNRLEYSVVLADEYAMVNNEVHRNLMDALPRGGCIRMFGDANQLQPIENDKYLEKQLSPFRKTLVKFNGIQLDTIHRQDEGSVIIENGARIVKGQMPRRGNNFDIRISDQLVISASDLVMDALSDGIDYGSDENQIICPTKVGWVGTSKINPLIQGLLQPTGKHYIEPERHTWAKDSGIRFYEGDKIIQTTNQYALSIFNGESGKITKLHDDGTISVDFGDDIKDIPPVIEVDGPRGLIGINPQRDLDLAYAITTHKSQGSEYKEVCYLMTKSRPYLLNRKNFYTGISRARTKVTVLCEQRALNLSLYKLGEP
jgi:exodeoxyribonuclease V alpha subunit